MIGSPEGGQIAAVFGALSLVAAVVIYNARMLIRESEKEWTEMNRTHMAERIFDRSHSAVAVPRYQRLSKLICQNRDLR